LDDVDCDGLGRPVGNLRGEIEGRFERTVLPSAQGGRLSARTGSAPAEVCVGRDQYRFLPVGLSEYHIIRSLAHLEVPNVTSRVTSLFEQPNQNGLKVLVEEKLHAVRSGSWRSCTARAANLRASEMSSASRSGCSARISSLVMPSATIATTVATGNRRPRMHGTPAILPGSEVILVNAIYIA